jgi:hypothetical protein
MLSFRVILIGLLSVVGSAWGDEVARTANISTLSSVQPKRIEVPRRNADQLAERIRIAAELIYSESPNAINLTDIRTAVSENLTASGTIALVDLSDRVALYESSLDQLIVARPDNLRRSGVPERAISETEARGIFDHALESLMASGVIKSEQFDSSLIEISKSFLGYGHSGTPGVSRLSEYDFLVYSRFDGVAFPHNRVSIAVGADGKIVRIGMGGPELRSVVKAPNVPIRVTPDMVREAFSPQFPDLTIEMIDLAYIISSDEIRTGKVIQPTYFVAARSAGPMASAAQTLEQRVLIEPERYFVIRPNDLISHIVEYGQPSR